MPPRLAQVETPGVEAVAPEQQAVGAGIRDEGPTDVTGHAPVVLGVLDDGHPLGVLVGGDTREALQHLETGDLQAPGVPRGLGQEGVPHGMRVENRARPSLSHHLEMDHGLVRRLAASRNDRAGVVHEQDLLPRDLTLVDAAPADERGAAGPG